MSEYEEKEFEGMTCGCGKKVIIKNGSLMCPRCTISDAKRR